MAQVYTSTLAVELLDRVSSRVKGVSASLGRLGQSYSGVTDTRARMDAAMARNEAALGRARAGLVDAVAGAYALKAAFGGTTGAAMALEDKMADLGKVSSMSDAQLKTFEGSLRRMARGEIPMAVEELAELSAAAAASGIDDADLEALTRQVAKSAVAWEVSGEYAGEALAKLKTALGMTIDETARYADAINFLSDATASNAPDLVEFARRVAADGKVAGFSNEEVLTLGSSMISMGAQADVAATSLRNAQKALTKGASATKRQDAAFKKLGLHADDVAKAMPNDAMGQFLDVLDRISKLDQHEQIATMSNLFGDEARALMPLLGQLDKLRENVRSTADETNYLGSVQKEFETRSKTGRYALQRFNNQVREVGISIGQALLPAMKRMLETAGPLLLAFADWTNENPRLIASLAAVTSGVIALRVALASLRFVGLLGKGGALSALSLGMNTVGAASGRLLGAARAAVALQTALGAMEGARALTKMQRLGIGLRAMVVAVPGISALGSALSAIGGAIAAISAPAWATFAAVAAVVAAVGYSIYRYWDRIKAVFTGVARAVSEILAPAFERMQPVFDRFAGIGDALSSAWQKVKSTLSSVGNWFSSFFQREVLSEDDKGRYEDAGYNLVMAFWNGMKAVMSKVVAWVKERIDAILAPFVAAKEKLSGWFGDGGGDGDGPAPGSGVDSARAKGGRISQGDRVLVGEEGPEVITARRSAYVHPNDDLHAAEDDGRALASRRRGGRAAAGPGPASITVNAPITITAVPGESAEAIARRARAELESQFSFSLRSALSDF